MNFLSNNTLWQKFAIVNVIIFSLFGFFRANAAEVSIQLHSGTEENAIGHSLIYSDTFTTNRIYRWGVAYSYINQLKATWNGQQTFFDNNNIDIYAGYRFFPKSYNSFWRPFSFEAQVGASVSLTENKFTFEEYPDQEIVFSEKHDINFMVNLLTQYQLTKQTKIQLGFKHYPSFSNFDSQSSIYLGLSYQFGKKYGY
jgi:hypothetical protein